MPTGLTATIPFVSRLHLAADGGAGAGFDQDAGPDPIVLEGLALPWGVTVQLNFWGDTVAFGRGSVDPPHPERVKFLLDHRPKPFGFATGFEDRPEGLWATVAIPREEMADPEVAAAVRQLGNGVRDALSVGVAIRAAAETETGKGWDAVVHYDVTDGELLELSSVVVPRFADARVARIAAGLLDGDDDPARLAHLTADLADLRGRLTHRKDRPMPAIAATATPVEPDDHPNTPEPDVPPDPEARMAAHRAALVPVGSTPTVNARSAGRYGSFGDYALAVALGTVEPAYQQVLEAAWVDEVTGDVPGIIPEQWMRDIIDLMGTVSTTVNLFSRRPLPDAGMVLHVPRVDQVPDVGPQTAEKTEIPSRKVTIGNVDFPVQTFAGGQDISMQVLLRSDPSYLTELMRLYAREMALQLNLSASAALLAGATVTSPVDPADLNGTIIDAAAVILTATYAFPQVMVMGIDWWKALGKAEDSTGRPLFPTLSPFNPVGSFGVTDGNGNVRGLDYAVDPSMPPDSAVVGLRDAFRTWVSPMRTLSVDVPRLLGRDVAVFEFAALGVTDTRGLVELTGTFPLVAGTTAQRAAGSKKAAS